MLKKLLIVTLFLIVPGKFIYAQTFKVTSIDASKTNLYDSAAKRYLGKNFQLNLYDGSAILILPASDKVIFRETSDNTYSYVDKDDDHESVTLYLNVNKTVGVVTSINLKLVVQEKVGQHRSAYYVVTAKRF